MLKKARLLLRSERFGVGVHLFEDWPTELPAALLSNQSGSDDEIQRMELYSDARLRISEDTFSVSYEETALTGMEGTQSQLSFARSRPELVTMLRTGAVSTALVFEKGCRHICTYRTPYMTFEVCVHTLAIDNRLEGGDGTLDLDYVIELRGAQAERCRMHLELK